MKKKKKVYSSEILLDITKEKGNLTYEDILKKLGHRSFGLAVIFFAIPSALPISTIPGIAFFFSIPIMIFALQMILMAKRMWLPKKISQKSVPQDKMSKIINKIMPYLKKLEKLLKPRWIFMFHPAIKILNAFMLLSLSLLLMLPIPFSNFIIATLIILWSLSSIEEDGLVMFLVDLSAIILIIFFYFFIFTAIKSLIQWLI